MKSEIFFASFQCIDKIMICMNLSHTDQVWKYKIYLKIKEAHVNVRYIYLLNKSPVFL